jgi:hypothetical protein
MMNRYLLTPDGLKKPIPLDSISAEMEKELNQAFQTRMSRGMRMERYLKYWYFRKV